MRGPYSDRQNKLGQLELILEECTRFEHRFKNVSALANYCANRINERSEGLSQAPAKELVCSGHLPAKAARGLHYRSLLRKNSTYRRLLDVWMHTNCGALSSFEQARIRELEVSLLKLANEHNLIKRLYAEALDELDAKGGLKIADRSIDDAFCIVKILLDRFSSDVIMEDGALKERSVVRTVFVSSKLMAPYLDWLQRII